MPNAHTHALLSTNHPEKKEEEEELSLAPCMVVNVLAFGASLKRNSKKFPESKDKTAKKEKKKVAERISLGLSQACTVCTRGRGHKT